MPKLTKGDVTVETELPTEINQLKAGGFRPAEEAAKPAEAVSASQDAANTTDASEGGKPADDAAAAKVKPAAGKPSK